MNRVKQYCLTHEEKTSCVFELVKIMAMIYVMANEETREWIRCMCVIIGPFLNQRFPELKALVMTSNLKALL